MSNRSSGWQPSWWMIVIGFVLCVVPGLVLLWLRRSTPVWTKVVVTAIFVPVFVAAAQGVEPSVAAAPSSPPSASVTASATPSASALESPKSASPSAAPSSIASAAPSAPAATALTNWPSSSTLAADAAAQLVVKGRAPKTGYDRDLFGSGWVDIDRNGCDTRNDVLAASLANVELSGPCKVTGGTLADPYTKAVIDFFAGSGTPVQIDHVVALSDAWQKGAQSWPWAKRVAFANDPLNLLAVDASTNMSKGDGDTATWLPPNKSFRCEYVSRQVAVKAKYGVSVTQAELDAMLRVLSDCPGQLLPAPGDQPTTAANTGGAEPKSVATKPAPSPSTPATSTNVDPQFPTCKAAIAAGYGPYYAGKDAEYDWYRDGDKDGIACER